MRTVTQNVDGIEDASLLISALKAMGLDVVADRNYIYFSGVLNGRYASGQYRDGKISSTEKFDLVELRKYIAMANIKKNAAVHRWILKPVEGNPLEIDIQKKHDTIRAGVLDGGVIKITCLGKISAPNHINADKLVASIQRDAGGEVLVTHLKHHHEHNHTHHHLHV